MRTALWVAIAMFSACTSSGTEGESYRIANRIEAEGMRSVDAACKRLKKRLRTRFKNNKASLESALINLQEGQNSWGRYSFEQVVLFGKYTGASVLEMAHYGAEMSRRRAAELDKL